MPVNGRKFKVRTGCITCKIRKVKCDENKPECTRCMSTGRKCDGYAKPEAEESEKPQALVPAQLNQALDRSNTLYVNVTALPGVTSANEHRWLEYFSQRAGPALSDFADKYFWTHILPQLSVSEPAIRHALLAVSSSYAQLEARLKSDSAIAVAKDDHSIKHYSLAITKLRQSLQQAPKDATVPLICCLLFICLECLYGNQPSMLNQLNNGLKILSSKRSGSNGVATPQSIERKLEQIFYRLDAQSTLSGKPMILPSGDPALAFNLEIPSTFSDIFEAKTYLDIVNTMSLNFIRLAIDCSLAERYPNHSAILIQRRLQDRFIAWRNALDNFEHTSSPIDYSHKEMIAKLRIEDYASFIYLSNCLEMEESSYDAYTIQFAAIVSLARDVLSSPEELAISEFASLSVSPSTSPSPAYSTGFSLEALLIPSLYLTAIKCRDPIIRRDAVSLLAKNNGREGLWDARLNWRLARKIIEIEEGNMLRYQGATEAFMEDAPSMRMQTSNGMVLTDLPYEEFRVQNADIKRTFEEEPRSPVHVTFYTRPNGVLERECAWEEEIHF